MSPPKARLEDAPTQPAAAAPKAFPVRPFTPRPMLFMGLLLLFVIWVGLLLTMYFRTVYPERHQSPATLPVSRPV